MQIKIFTITVFECETAEEEMNRFLRSHRVLDVESHFIDGINGGFWSFCVKYISGPGLQHKKQKGNEARVDYKEVLDEKIFNVFSKLREYRKIIAAEDAIPAYAVFTDAELAEIAKLSPLNQKELLSVKGIGEKKAERFGKRIIDLYQKSLDEKGGQVD